MQGTAKAHAVGHEPWKLVVQKQDHVREQPNDRQPDGHTAVVVFAQCVAQHERLVRVVGVLIAHLRPDDDLDDNHEVEDEAKLP